MSADRRGHAIHVAALLLEEAWAASPAGSRFEMGANKMGLLIPFHSSELLPTFRVCVHIVPLV